MLPLLFTFALTHFHPCGLTNSASSIAASADAEVDKEFDSTLAKVQPFFDSEATKQAVRDHMSNGQDINYSITWIIVEDPSANATVSDQTLQEMVNNANAAFDRANIRFTLGSVERLTDPSLFTVKDPLEFGWLENSRLKNVRDKVSADQRKRTIFVHTLNNQASSFGNLPYLSLLPEDVIVLDVNHIAGRQMIQTYDSTTQARLRSRCESLSTSVSTNGNCDEFRSLVGPSLRQLDVPVDELECSAFVALCTSLTEEQDGTLLIHELGHYFGLLHVFQGGCATSGNDFVSDTPAEKTFTGFFRACSAPQDTCPNVNGMDSLNNYMNYVLDECDTQFTQGQYERIVASALGYRIEESDSRYLRGPTVTISGATSLIPVVFLFVIFLI